MKDFVYLIVIAGTLLTFLYWSFREARRNDERDNTIEVLRECLWQAENLADQYWQELRVKQIALRCAAKIGQNLEVGKHGEARFLWDMSHGITIRNALKDHDGPNVYAITVKHTTGVPVRMERRYVVVANEVDEAFRCLGLIEDERSQTKILPLGPYVPPLIVPYVPPLIVPYIVCEGELRNASTI